MKKDYIIIDWSSHLPGPYACHQLAKLGFNVIKPIKKDKLMPFQKISKLELEPLNIFDFWFHSFNKGKELLYYSDERDLEELFKRADGVITNKPNLPFETQAVVTNIIASHEDSHPRHDINAFADSRLLKNDLPVLPWAGIELANKLVQNHLKQLLTEEKQITVSLQSSINELSETLSPQNQTHHLHTGAFPCYQTYQLKDKSWVALGAVEEKFWNQFCEYFKLEFSSGDRFDLSGLVQGQLESFFKELSPTASMKNGETKVFCLSLF